MWLTRQVRSGGSLWFRSTMISVTVVCRSLHDWHCYPETIHVSPYRLNGKRQRIEGLRKIFFFPILAQRDARGNKSMRARVCNKIDTSNGSLGSAALRLCIGGKNKVSERLQRLGRKRYLPLRRLEKHTDRTTKWGRLVRGLMMVNCH